MKLGCIAAVASLTASALILTACGGTTDDSVDGTINVVASTDVWGSVVKAVGGDAVSVTALIDSPAKDPHDYETSSLDAAKISKAKLVVYNGDGYDDFFAKAVDAVGRNQKRLIAFDVSGKRKSANTNEHVFYDLPTVKQVADSVAAQLSKLNGAKKDTFTANAAKFNAQIDGLADSAKQIGATHPNESVVATEPVADYLLELAGVKDATPRAFEEAVEADQDIPAQAAVDVRSLISERKVAAVINNAQAETGTTKELKSGAARAGVPVVNVTETFPKGVKNYVDWMKSEVEALATALNKG